LVVPFYITKWMKDFRGGSQKFYLFLTYCSGSEIIFGLLMLVFFGINTELMNVIKLMGMSIVSNMILVSVESIITLEILKMDYTDCWIKLLKHRLV
jgi:vacuolar-type H+-ATPase subunit I/STV1